MVEDTTIRDLELKALQNEAEWFVGSEVPKVGRKIKRLLQHCMAFLSPKGAQELELLGDQLVPMDDDDEVVIPPLDNSNKLTSFETPDGSLKGFIGVGGWSVSSADFSVKFPKWNKGIPHKATVSATHPWRLYQLQNAYNFVKMTLNELNLLINQCAATRSPSSLSSSYSSFSPPSHSSSSSSSSNSASASSSPPSTPSSSSAPPPTTPVLPSTPQITLAAVNKLVGQISKWMSLARDSLMIPNKSLLFPNSLVNTGFQGFHPALPQDLHVEFSVCNSEIIVSVYALYFGSGPMPMNYDNLPQKVIGTGSPNPNRLSMSLSGLKTLDKSPGSPTGMGSSSSLLTPNSGLSSSGSGIKHRTPSVGNLLNLPASFTFSGLSSGDKAQSSSQLGKIDEIGDHHSQAQDGDGSVPSINVAGAQGSAAQSSADHRVSIGGISYRTYQINQRGAPPSWVAVLDQAEVHCIIPRINETLHLLLSALDFVADIEDKLVALSLL